MAHYYLDAPCGAGKTEVQIDIIYANLHRANYLVAVPSHAIQREWQRRLADHGIAADVITCNDGEKGSVPVRIQRALKDSPLAGKVLVITHQAFNLLPYLPRLPWRIVIDEAPETQWFYEQSITHNADIFLSLVEVEMPWPANPDLLVLRAKPKTNIRRRISGAKCAGDEGWRKLLQDIVDRRRIVLVTRAQWEKLEAKAFNLDRDVEANYIGFLSVYDFSAHHEVNHHITYVAANFANSFAAKIAKIEGREFRPIRRTFPSTQPRSLTIEYHLEDKFCSKARMRKQALDGLTVKESILESVATDWAGTEYLYLLNKDTPDQETGTRMEFSEIRGVNEYRTFDRVFIGAACNLKPMHYNLLGMTGIGKYEAQKAVALEMAYQAVMRTCLRDRKSTNPVTIRVVDKLQAMFLKETIGFGEVVQAKEVLAADPKMTKSQAFRDKLQARINQARADLADWPHHPNRHHEANRIGVELMWGGLSDADIEAELMSAAGADRRLREHAKYGILSIKKLRRRNRLTPGPSGLT